ncbi:BZ3500_MvSof-1268-A1-R1_Chr10-1g02632 [Microbotryum saponariae]|uniref:BZ3500_MvSof-1268-A1-R1_Chr10-1g02632 protein n=1 Tax=Microbotryum saponariae TaxID=289078 RepID=A0A2X0LGQ7_9BASI|nr:BZ3500_MvSof-1268-A1-R1_Chr10-1g02632 [Microbotryum saponariae]SDA06121.1 BZ3501_MvSof-1269-A2-R1_Chr10-1g02233 [Microbotryum saponariae]
MTAIPVKRAALPHSSSSDAKTARLQGMDSAHSQPLSTTTPKARSALAAAAKGIRKPAGFNHVLVNFFDAILEERNCMSSSASACDWGANDEALLALEGMIAHHQIPHQTHIRQLLSLSLSTLSSLGGPSTTTSTSTLTPTVSSTTLDPIPLTERKLRLQALHLLERIARSNSVQAILRSVPGHAPRDPLLQALYEDYLPTSKSLNPDNGPIDDDRLDEVIIDEAEDDDTELVVSARRMAQRTTCEDVWALLGGSADRIPKSRDKDRPLTKGGWETLGMFVASWEDEQRMKVQTPNGVREVGFAPSLMQTFKSNSIGIREVSPRVLDIVFWPFSKVATEYYARDLKVHDQDEEDSHDERLFEMELAEKRRIASRLLALVSNAAIIGRLNHLAWVGDIAGRMRDLSLTSLPSFLEHFTTTSHPHFVIRILARYLELTSHPLPPLQLATTTSSTSEAQSASSIPSHLSGLHASPRRRPMSQQSSVVSLEGGAPPPSPVKDLSSALQNVTKSRTDESSATTTVVIPSEIPYFNTRLSLPAILQLLRGVPTQFPPSWSTTSHTQGTPVRSLPPRRRSAAAPETEGGGSMKGPSVVEKALERAGLVKRYLVEIWGGDGSGVGEEDAEKCEEVMDEVEQGLRKGVR